MADADPAKSLMRSVAQCMYDRSGRSTSRALRCALAACVFQLAASLPLSSQQPAPDSAAVLGPAAGAAAADEGWAESYFVAGALGGLGLGLVVLQTDEPLDPVQTGLAVASGALVLGTFIVGGRYDEIPPDVRRELSGRDPVFRAAFEREFLRRQRSRRQNAALLGGLLGAAGLFGLYYYANSGT